MSTGGKKRITHKNAIQSIEIVHCCTHTSGRGTVCNTRCSINDKCQLFSQCSLFLLYKLRKLGFGGDLVTIFTDKINDG